MNDARIGECWLHPATRVGASLIDGQGLFATAPIRLGEPMMRLGGILVDDEGLAALFEERARDPTIPYVDTVAFDTHRHLVLPTGAPQHFGNHSCDPNLWWADARTLVARRDIELDEELTSDYGTSSVGGFGMTCRCGSPLCRGVITGEDWRRADLRARYGRHFVPVLLARIDGSVRYVRNGELASPGGTFHPRPCSACRGKGYSPAGHLGQRPAWPSRSMRNG